MSELALKLIAEAKATHAKTLDLGNCDLTELPDELFELVWLEELYLCTEGGYWDLKTNKWIYFESLNKSRENNVSHLSYKIGQLKNLRILLINGWFEKWALSDLNALRDLLCLENLSINNTRINDLSPLQGLVNLRHLSVFDTLINDLSKLSDLENLRYISIQRTQVKDLTPLFNCINLEQINISETKVNDLSPLRNAVNLIQLDISDTEINNLNVLNNLSKLEYLNMQRTQIINLSALRKLINLRNLFIQNTKVRDLSPLYDLVNLEHLNISDTKVNNLNPLYNLINLRELSLAYTRVNDLGPLGKVIENNINLYLNTRNCPLNNPPEEVVKLGNLAIFRYLKESKRTGLKPVNEARLLLVGEGEAGKTSLKVKLHDAQADLPEHDATTKGIEVSYLACQDVIATDFNVHVWDFGGQNIQKYAHQFFLSDSVVYAVLVNTRKQNPNFAYWLNIIELLGKDSPFVIVHNEKDGHTEDIKNLTQIQERFPKTYRGVESVNLKAAGSTDTLRFENLKRKLLTIATQLPHTQKQFAGSFVNVREALKTLAINEQSITYRDFIQLCQAEGMTDRDTMRDYAAVFTQLGIALHFADNPYLEGYVFLRPKWLIDALFELLYHPSVSEQKGKFTKRDANTIWQAHDYDGMHGILLELMQEFHLCYKIDNQDRFIVPQRLPSRRQENAFIPSNDSTQLLYRYKFMPSGILTQLTCRLHHRIDNNQVWNDAVQFVEVNGSGRVFVRENEADNQLEIFGLGQHKSDILNQVVDILDDIHRTTKFGNLRVDKYVPCPSTHCQQQRNNKEESGLFNFGKLIKQINKGKHKSDDCDICEDSFEINHILKQSHIRPFNLSHVKELISKDKLDDVLQILRGAFPNHDEVIQLSGRLSHFYKEKRTNTLFDADIAWNNLRADVLATVNELGNTN